MGAPPSVRLLPSVDRLVPRAAEAYDQVADRLQKEQQEEREDTAVAEVLANLHGHDDRKDEIDDRDDVEKAELAAAHPTSGGAYAYGRAEIGPWWGFVAGWAFIIGKLASCAAMAITFAADAAPPDGSARHNSPACWW